MSQIFSLGTVTVDLNIQISDENLRHFGIEPGSNSLVDEPRIEDLRSALERASGKLPDPLSGGSVANTTTLIARSPLDCGFIGVGGNDSFGRQFRSDCDRAGVNLHYPLQDGLVTGYNFCFSNKSGKSTIFWTAGANNYMTPDIIDEEAIRSAELMVIDGFTFGLGKNGPATVQHAALLSRRHNIPYILTLASVQMIENYRELYHELAPDAQFIVGNLEQAACLVNLSGKASLDEVNQILPNLCSNILITLGDAGVYARFGNKEYSLSTCNTHVRDTTGAGDAFLGAFIVARARGLSIPKALSVGNSIAGEVVQIQGARLPFEINVPPLIEEAIERAVNID